MAGPNVPSNCCSTLTVFLSYKLSRVSVPGLPSFSPQKCLYRKGGDAFLLLFLEGVSSVWGFCLGVLSKCVTQASVSVVSSPRLIFARLQLSVSYCSARADRPGFGQTGSP